MIFKKNIINFNNDVFLILQYLIDDNSYLNYSIFEFLFLNYFNIINNIYIFESNILINNNFSDLLNFFQDGNNDDFLYLFD